MKIRLQGLTDDPLADALHVPPTREELVEQIHRALEISGGRRHRAARLLGISARTINRYIGPKPGTWGGHVVPEPPPLKDDAP